METSSLNPDSHIKASYRNWNLCPSCYRRNRAWVLYSRCPFCGAKGKTIRDVVGPEWEAALAELLRVTEGHANRCGAPLCWGTPDGLLPSYFWYPDEPICAAASRTEPLVARRMRRIAKVARTAPRPEPDEPGYPGLMDSYFTLEDLRSMRRVDRRIVGRNPDREGRCPPEVTQERRGVDARDAILEVMP